MSVWPRYDSVGNTSLQNTVTTLTLIEPTNLAQTFQSLSYLRLLSTPVGLIKIYSLEITCSMNSPYFQSVIIFLSGTSDLLELDCCSMVIDPLFLVQSLEIPNPLQPDHFSNFKSPIILSLLQWPNNLSSSRMMILSLDCYWMLPW